ncbi:hypothetical protein [Bradyrhizobium sp. dw_411]|uniref:hypothetical protein n=1 Tax=Bradyrhizobium sp. dw_411 TaxID=2720082 RepID=UPI001BD1054C|nr:hypothetical protein [Bradyrhizobium sp. dw_411]
MYDKTYILTSRKLAATSETDAEMCQALAHDGIHARITHRLPWGIVVRSDPTLVGVVRREFPNLDIAEEGFVDLAGR